MWKKILSVIVILFVFLCGLSILTMRGYHHDRASAVKTQIKNFGEVLKLYKMKRGFYRSY